MLFFLSSCEIPGAVIPNADRPTTAAPFGSIAQVPVVDAPGLDHPTWISPDDCRLYLHSDRTGGSGGFDYYVAERAP